MSHDSSVISGSTGPYGSVMHAGNKANLRKRVKKMIGGGT